MHLSKNTSLLILGVTAMPCSRALFFFFNDPEGPNLLIVVGLAAAIYLLSFAAYAFVPTRLNGLSRLLLAVVVQVLAVIVLYFCMR